MNTRQKKYQIVIRLTAVACLVLALFSNLVLTSFFNTLPKDFSYSADLNSEDNLFDTTQNRFKGAQSSRSQFSYDVTSHDDQTVQIKNLFDVKTLSGEEIIHIERDYAIDRQSRSHVEQNGIQSRSGYLFAPTNLKPDQNFDYWHVNYNRAVNMQFQAEESFSGLKTYRYYSEFEVDQTQELDQLPGVPEKYGIRVNVQLTTWIEPTTGRMIKYQDNGEANYYDQSTKEVVMPWNRYSNKFTQPSVTRQLTLARAEVNKIWTYEQLLPSVFIVLALILFALSFINPTVIVRRLPYLIIVVGIIGTSGAIANELRQVQIAEEGSFDREASRIEDGITSRMRSYNNGLFAAQGLLQASDEVNYKEWQTFNNILDIPNRLPGVQGVGYSVKVGDSSDVKAFEARQQTELNLPDFQIKPAGERDEYHSIIYLEPQNERNQRAIGFDMYQDPTRKKAMDEAIDNGTTVLSETVRLVQEDGENEQNGFLLLLPHYQKDVSIKNAAERRAAFEAFVYSPFRGKDFMDSVVNDVSRGMKFRVYSEYVDAEQIIFDNTDSTQEKPIKHNELELFSSKWILEYYPSPEVIRAVDRSEPVMLGVRGFVLTTLITGLVVLLNSTGARAQALANKQTAQLRKSEQGARILAKRSLEIQAELEESQKNLLEQNQLLENSKLAMFNLLEDLSEEKQTQGESLTKNLAILSSIGDGLLVTDRDGHIRLTNPAFTDLLGWKYDEVANKPLSQVLPFLDDAGNEVEKDKDLMEQTLQRKTSGVLAMAENIYLKRKDGSLTPVVITMSPILEGKRATGVVMVIHDVTKERQIDRAKSEFVSLASHQLRTPLTAINWYTDMLVAGDAGKLTAEQAKYLGEIKFGNKRMIELVNALLNVSRIELGTFMIEPEPTDLIELCKAIVRDNEPRIFESKLDFKENYDKLPVIPMDPKLMRIVIENLVTNAIKYTPEGGSASLTVKQEKQNILITVQDTGYGIPKIQQDKIFGKLFRADNVKAHDTEGTGLGLYIAKSVTESSGGRIWFESVEDKGTTFHVELPLSGMKARKGSRKLD